MADNPIFYTTVSVQQLYAASTPVTWLDFGNFGTVTSISMQCCWTGLNAADGQVVMGMRQDMAAGWTPIPDLFFTMANPSDSCVLINNGFFLQRAGLMVNIGSSTIGTINVWIIPGDTNK
jgi:hypothetical protein